MDRSISRAGPDSARPVATWVLSSCGARKRSFGGQHKPIEVDSSKRFLLKCAWESSKVAGMSAFDGPVNGVERQKSGYLSKRLLSAAAVAGNGWQRATATAVGGPLFSSF